MFIAEKPYFMTNKKWYYFDEKERRIKLTDKAPEKARKNYEEFQAISEGEYGEG